MNKKTKQLFFALIVGVIALVANQLYVSDRLSELDPGKRVDIVRAKTGIAAGTELSRSLVEKVTLPKKYAPLVSMYWSELDDNLGQPFSVNVEAGDYVLKNYFKARQVVGKKLSDQVEGESFRAVTLPVDQTGSLAASVVPGDLIDLIYTFAVPESPLKMSVVLLQSIPVISTGTYSASDQEMGEHGGKPKQYSTLTLKLSAQDALKLNYARQTGKIDIALRNSADSKVMEFKPIASVIDLLSAEDKAAIESLKRENQATRASMKPSDLNYSTMDKEKVRKQLEQYFKLHQEQQQAGN